MACVHGCLVCPDFAPVCGQRIHYSFPVFNFCGVRVSPGVYSVVSGNGVSPLVLWCQAHGVCCFPDVNFKQVTGTPPPPARLSPSAHALTGAVSSTGAITDFTLSLRQAFVSESWLTFRCCAYEMCCARWEEMTAEMTTCAAKAFYLACVCVCMCVFACLVLAVIVVFTSKYIVVNPIIFPFFSASPSPGPLRSPSTPHRLCFANGLKHGSACTPAYVMRMGPKSRMTYCSPR